MAYFQLSVQIRLLRKRLTVSANSYERNFIMSGKHVKVIIDTNLWISFLIGLKSSSILRSILTDGKITIVMTDILQQEIMTVASRPKLEEYYSHEK